MPNPSDRSGGLQVATPEINPSGFWQAIDVSGGDVAVVGVRGVFIGVAGNLAMKDQNGTSATWAVVSGQLLPIAPSAFLQSGTTAAGVFALK